MSCWWRAIGRSRLLGNERGLSLIELIVTMIILAILAAAILPLTQVTSKRMKEMELRRNLRIIRTAIDDCKRTYDDLAKQNKVQVVAGKSGCPETLKALVDGIDFGTSPDGKTSKKKFLRRIPVDPFNPPKPGEEPEWGMRSYSDEPDSDIWGEEDVYDVYSKSNEIALDGTKYADW